ncbi:MAG: TetR/AcrR family transcriptional regulator [Actinomadura sp.]
MRATPRSYRGRTADERRAERRAKLIGAALEIWGEQGWAAVTMRGVCARTGLVNRYFYENFADRDALLLAVWQRIRDETVGLLLHAISDQPRNPEALLRAAASAFVHALIDDPRRARIGFGEHAGSPVLEQARRESLEHFTRLLIETGRPFFRPGIDETDLHMTVYMAIGGFSELVTAWLGGAVPVDAETLIDHATRTGMTLTADYL